MEDSKYIDADDYYDMAYEWLRRKDYENAGSYFKKAIELNPRFIHAYIELSAVYAALKNFHDAIAILRKALEYDPNFDRLYYLIAKYAYKNNDLKRAMKSIEKAIEINPDRLYARIKCVFEEKYRQLRQ